MFKSRLQAIAAVGALALLVSLGVAAFLWHRVRDGNPTSAVVRIGYTPLVYAQPAFVALDRKYFEANGVGVEVTRFENSTQLVNAVIGGQLDFCAIAPVLSVFAAEDRQQSAGGGGPLFKLLYYNTDSKEHPISFLLVKKTSPLRSLEDLKGKRMGVFPGNILSRTSARLLLAPYMNVEKEITFQDVAPQFQAQALESGQVDVLFSLEPYATITLEEGGARILHVAPQLSVCDNLPGGCGFFSAKFVTDHPDEGGRFYAALEKAVADIRGDELQAKEVFPKYTPLTLAIAQKVHQPIFVMATEMTGDALQQEYDILRREAVLTNALNTRELIFTKP